MTYLIPISRKGLSRYKKLCLYAKKKPETYEIRLEIACEAEFIITNTNFESNKLHTLKTEDLKVINSNTFHEANINEEATCFIQFSSGSTQTPKGVVITHKNLTANLKQIHEGMRVSNNDSICSWLPLHHDMGLVGTLLSSLYGKVCSHLMPPLDFILSPKSWIELVSTKEISVIVAPNSAYNICVKKISAKEIKKLDLTNLRLALTGAEPVNEEICQKFVDHFTEANINPNVIFPVYGLAECTLAVTFNDLDNPFKCVAVDYEHLLKRLYGLQNPLRMP